jgi:DNA-binding IclR family transcriptional regulator
LVDAVKSADRVLQVFDLLATEPQGLSFTEIRERLELPKSSAHTLLATLVVNQYITLDEGTRRYAVGLRLWQAGQAYLPATGLEQAALPYLQNASDAVNETAQLAILDGTENVYIAKVDAKQQLTLASRVGGRLPAYATGIGKALLSGLTDDEVRARFRGIRFTHFTPHTVTSLRALLAELRTVRERGYATDQGEYTPGVHCVAMPVLDRSGGICAAMSISVPSVRMSESLHEKICKVLGNETDALSARLGHNRRSRPA